MSKFLDLHGKSIDEATAKVQNIFFEFDENLYETELYIMVGKGTGALKECVESLLEEKESDYQYTYDDIRSTFIVRKIN